MPRTDAALDLLCGTLPRRQEGAEPAAWQLRPRSDAVQRVLRKVSSHPRRNLTVGRHPAFVWYRNAKVGTRTIYKALVDAGVDFVAEHPTEVVVPRALLTGRFSFAFVRDPRTRLVSCWRDKVLDHNSFRLPPGLHHELQDFGAFVAWVGQQDLSRCDRHYRLQSALVDVDALEFLGKVETFDVDFARLCERLLIPWVPERRNASIARSDPYTPEIEERVLDLYRRDVEAFSYAL